MLDTPKADPPKPVVVFGVAPKAEEPNAEVLLGVVEAPKPDEPKAELEPDLGVAVAPKPEETKAEPPEGAVPKPDEPNAVGGGLDAAPNAEAAGAAGGAVVGGALGSGVLCFAGVATKAAEGVVEADTAGAACGCIIPGYGPASGYRMSNEMM